MGCSSSKSVAAQSKPSEGGSVTADKRPEGERSEGCSDVARAQEADAAKEVEKKQERTIVENDASDYAPQTSEQDGGKQCEVIAQIDVEAKDRVDGYMDSTNPSHDIDYAATAEGAIQQAERLMSEAALVCEADAVLTTALSILEVPSASEPQKRAARRLRDSSVHKDVMRRIAQLESISAVLIPTAFKLQWETADACLWLNAPPGETWFEYKVAVLVDAPICNLYVALHELDLQTRHQPMLVGPPVFVGDHNRNLMVTRSLISVLIFRIELVIEVMRFVDKQFGFLAERITSDFPQDDLPIPAKHWRNQRVLADTKALAIPCGAGGRGTIVIQATRVQVGMRIPDFALNFFCNKLSQEYMENLRRMSNSVSQPGNPWRERLDADADGFYKDLADAESAASKRAAVSLSSLPGPEIIRRLGQLSKVVDAVSTIIEI